MSDISNRCSLRYSNITFVSPKYNRETEGGKPFAVSAINDGTVYPRLLD